MNIGSTYNLSLIAALDPAFCWLCKPFCIIYCVLLITFEVTSPLLVSWLSFEWALIRKYVKVP